MDAYVFSSSFFIGSIQFIYRSNTISQTASQLSIFFVIILIYLTLFLRSLLQKKSEMATGKFAAQPSVAAMFSTTTTNMSQRTSTRLTQQSVARRGKFTQYIDDSDSE